MNAEYRRGDAMSTNRTKNAGQHSKPQQPYPYNVTRNPVLLKVLLEGFKIEKTALRVNEHEVLVADVTLVKGTETKTLKGVFGKDTPAGRAAIREAEAEARTKTPSKKTRVGKTAKDIANGVAARHLRNKKTKKAANQAAARYNGCGRGSNGTGGNDSAKKAKLGKGQKQ